MLKYKLTTQEKTTRNNTLWGANTVHETNGKGELCGPGWLHYYHTPDLAVLLNPVHAYIRNPRLWEAEAEGEHKDDHGLKGGCTRLTTLREIDLPTCSLDQRREFGIRCALEVCREEKFVLWAEKWLMGNDRSFSAASAISFICNAAWNAAYESILKANCKCYTPITIAYSALKATNACAIDDAFLSSAQAAESARIVDANCANFDLVNISFHVLHKKSPD